VHGLPAAAARRACHGYRIDALEWSAAGGWAADSFGRSGLYLRLGVNARY